MFSCDTFTCTFNLQEEDFPLANIAYNIRVRAVNGNGESEASNEISYTRVGSKCGSINGRKAWSPCTYVL